MAKRGSGSTGRQWNQDMSRHGLGGATQRDRQRAIAKDPTVRDLGAQVDAKLRESESLRRSNPARSAQLLKEANSLNSKLESAEAAAGKAYDAPPASRVATHSDARGRDHATSKPGAGAGVDDQPRDEQGRWT